MSGRYACSRCNGLGRLPVHSNVLGGVCFKCHGTKTQPTKPRPRAIRWAVFGRELATGQAARLYNVSAKAEGAAVERARQMMVKASQAFRDQFTLDGATAVRVDELDEARR